jgi:hypothetical protein
MTHKEKLLERLRNNRKNVRFEELDMLLTDYGFAVRQPRGGSSHFIYRRGKRIITIACHEPFVHPKAVKEVLEAIDEILETGV